ncbi:degenerin-like protein unc-105 [Glandiceps talaboti]
MMIKESEFSRHHKIFRALWSVFLIIVAVVYSVNIIQYVAVYLSYRTTQEVNKLEITTESMLFPAVTLCNVNKLRKSDIETSQYSDLLLLDIPGALSNLMPYEGPCFEGDFVCNENGGSSECVKWYMRCNGIVECRNGEDETNCKNSNKGLVRNDMSCSVENDGFFKCNNSKCIPDKLQCDYIDNCGDFSDEDGCVYPTDCTGGENTFQCENKTDRPECVPLKFKCDRINHCRDGSDENGCNYKIVNGENTPIDHFDMNWTQSYENVGAKLRHFEDFQEKYKPSILTRIANEESPSLIRLLLASNSPTFDDVMKALDIDAMEIRNYGYKMEDALLQCNYNGERCEPGDFTITQHKQFGNCFTFNGNTSRKFKAKRPGPEHGLKLILSAEQEEALGIFGGHCGYKVIVHDREVVAQPDIDGFPASPGMLTSVSTNKVITNRLAAPYSLCSTEHSSQMECQKKCFHSNVDKHCGCDNTLMGDLNSTRCDPHNSTQDFCRQLMEYLFRNGIVMCDCPPPCSSTQFKTTLVQTPWPSATYLPLLVNSIRAARNNTWTMSNELIERNNIVSIEVYMSTLGYSEVFQVPDYTMAKLLRDLGQMLAVYMTIALLIIVLAYICCGPKGETGYLNAGQKDDEEKGGDFDEAKDQDTSDTTEF